jgi:uncharacterized repeat protein (TIGR04076 family)
MDGWRKEKRVVQVRVTVVDGVCQGGVHKMADTFIAGDTTPEGICVDAWAAIAPYVMTLRCGGDFNWAKENGTAVIHCPDPCGITLELRRMG